MIHVSCETICSEMLGTMKVCYRVTHAGRGGKRCRGWELFSTVEVIFAQRLAGSSPQTTASAGHLKAQQWPGLLCVYLYYYLLFFFTLLGYEFSFIFSHSFRSSMSSRAVL
jgi:hypothetical protein